MIRIGIDPGVHECGVAIEWRGDRTAFIARAQESSLTGRALNVATQVANGGPGTFDVAGAHCVVLLCVEGQQVYRSEKSKGDPNDMIKLATVAGIMVGALDAVLSVHDIAMPLPRQWKGSVPKDIHHARLARDYPHWVEPVAADTPKSLQNHVWDAVGLLEWHKERSET